MGNIKESIIPYAKKHFKLAQLSFDRYGALSPSEDKQSTEIAEVNTTGDMQQSTEDKIGEDVTNSKKEKSDNDIERKSISPRNFSQVECESSAPPVSTKNCLSYKVFLFTTNKKF